MTLKDRVAFPMNEYRPLIALFWNAGIDRLRLAEQIDWVRDAGYGGFMVLPWHGIPYGVMAEAWLEAVEFALDRARHHGLEVWIWDDWLFPSGFGGGLVTADNAFWGRRLHLAVDIILEPEQSVSLVVPERFVAAGAVPINKYTAPAGEWQPLMWEVGERIDYRAANQRERLFMVTWDYSSWHEATVTVDSDHDERSVDMLNPKATDRFLQVIHDRYAERVSEYFGDTLKGFFYDEPMQAFPYPWTGEFAARFQASKGYDIRPHLPLMIACLSNLFTEWSASYVAQVRDHVGDYFDVWTDLCAESFYGKLERWCHQHGVLSIGHQDLDHRLRNLATVSGHFFKNSAHNDRPGIDVIWDQIVPGRFNDFPRYAGSAARVLGKKRAMSESLAAMGYGMHVDAMRYVLEHQIVRGVTQFFLLSLHHDTDLPPEAPELGPSNPVAAAFAPNLNERIGRLNVLMNAGVSSVEVGLYVPMRDIALYQPLLSFPHAGNLYPLPWEATDRIAEHLAYLPCEFDYVWEEALDRMELGDGGFKSPLGHTYRTLILPPRITLKSSVMDRLRAFCESGGRLLVVEQATHEMGNFATVCPAVSDLDRYLRRRVRIEPGGTRIALAGRIDGQRETYLMLNEDTDTRDVTLGFSGQGRLLELNPCDGSLTLLKEGDSLQVTRKFGGTGLCAFIIDPIGELDFEPALTPSGTSLVPSDWKLTLPDGKGFKIKDSWPDWNELGWPEYTGWMTYSAPLHWPYTTMTALLDLGEVCYGAEVFLDDERVAVAPFRPYQVMLSRLRQGEHRLSIRVLNTPANAVCGTPRREKEAFPDGGPSHLVYDRQKLRSGLFGPVTVTPFS